MLQITQKNHANIKNIEALFERLKIVCILKVLSTTNTYFHFIFKEGHWIWENSGAPFSYTYWNSGEPSGGNENCLAYWSSTRGWNDAPCDYDTAYKPLCQIIA